MVRLKDIALRARVSVMTVSKVLRNAPDVSNATKTRIRLLAHQMGYVPDSMAQGLRTRKTKLFGLVLSNTTNPLLARAVGAVEECAHQFGYELLLAQSLHSIQREDTVLRRFLARRVDGVFLMPVYRLGTAAPIYDELRRSGVPVVVLGPRPAFCDDFLNAELDELHGSQTVLQHLAQLGHRRIAFLAGPQFAPWARLRCEGYRRGLREAQIDLNDSLLFNAGTSFEEGQKAAQQLLDEQIDFTALQAVNDFVAMGAAQALLQSGRAVPQDVSVAGFGNVLGSAYFRVPLTTFREPQAELGQAAMNLMLKRIRGEPCDTARLSGELIVRASTGAPPNR